MTDLTSPYIPERGTAPLSAYNLAVIVLLSALAGLALAYVIDALTASPKTVPVSTFSAPFVEKNIACAALHVPQDWLRDPQTATTGFADQVDLLLNVDFRTAIPATVGLLLTPHSRAQSSAYLLDKVYLHQFLAEQLSGPPGLIGKPLREEDGFAAESVWYDPLSPMPFVAKCQQAPVETVPAQCIRTVRLTDGLSVTYSFAENLLSDWPRFDEIMRPVLEQMGAVPER